MGGEWQSKSAWDKTTGDLSGVAGVYDDDWNLLVSGEDSAGNSQLAGPVLRVGGVGAAGSGSGPTGGRSAPSGRGVADHPPLPA